MSEIVKWSVEDKVLYGQIKQISNTTNVSVIDKLIELDNGDLESSGDLVEMNSSLFEDSVQAEVKTSLASQFKLFKKGLAERPTISKSAQIISDPNAQLYKVVMTEELEDRDGEVVLIRGGRLAENGIVFIDCHDMGGSVVKTRLGTVVNIRVEDNKIVGDILLVDTYMGKEVKKILDDPRHPFPVSMGFGVYDYDINTKEIKEWELYELSAVNVPANPKAGVVRERKKITEDDENLDDKLKKKLDHYSTIRPAYKEFIKSFLSDNYCRAIGYEKTGQLLVDISNVHEISLSKLTAKVETPQAKITSIKPKIRELTPEEAKSLAETLVSKLL